MKFNPVSMDGTCCGKIRMETWLTGRNQVQVKYLLSRNIILCILYWLRSIKASSQKGCIWLRTCTFEDAYRFRSLTWKKDYCATMLLWLASFWLYSKETGTSITCNAMLMENTQRWCDIERATANPSHPSCRDSMWSALQISARNIYRQSSQVWPLKQPNLCRLAEESVRADRHWLVPFYGLWYPRSRRYCDLSRPRLSSSAMQDIILPKMSCFCWAVHI